MPDVLSPKDCAVIRWPRRFPTQYLLETLERLQEIAHHDPPGWLAIQLVAPTELPVFLAECMARVATLGMTEEAAKLADVLPGVQVPIRDGSSGAA